MRIRRKIVFSPHIRKDAATNSYPLRMRVSYAGNRVDFPTGYNINPLDFDKTRNRIAGGKDRDKINAELTDMEGRINDIFSRFELIEKRMPEPKEIRSAFMAKPASIKKAKPPTIFKIFDQFTLTMGRQNGWTPETYRKFNNVKTHLRNFDRRLTLEKLTEEKLTGFLQYMFSKKLMNSTIAKNLSYIRWFLRWCVRQGLYTGKLHETFRPRLKSSDKVVIYLTWDEVMHLYNMELPNSGNKHLEHTKDVFLFCCFTGLRHSDVYRLKIWDVKKNHIAIVTQKTSDPLTIELNKYSRAILEKYKGRDFRNNKALPVYTNQKMNDHLKIIGKKAGFDDPIRLIHWRGNHRLEQILPKYELLTTHCGRRTFIVNGLYLGISAEVIMKWTGHADYQAMKPYIAIVDDLKEQEMKKFNR